MASSPDPKAGGLCPPEQSKQGDTVPPLSKNHKSRFPWKSFFHRSATAVFVLGPNGRLRYANPAWESLTGKSFTALRGTRISAKRESASPLWKVLAPPPEAWAGTPIQIRRARPEVEYGPPWWDVQFVPLNQANGQAVIGFVTQVGETPEKHAFREPEALAATRAEHAKGYTLELFAGSSPLLQKLQNQIRTAAQVDSPVWIHGEPGSGKETIARTIHHIGKGREKSFVALDCKALQPYMIESLCFGRGGFGRSREVGTLLLKRPELLPRDLQMRFVELAKSLNPPRLISISERASWGVSKDDSLVDGFLGVLSTLAIPTLPLRYSVWLDHLPRVVECMGIGACDEGIWPALRSYNWHGNFREFRAAMSEAANNASGSTIRVEHLPKVIRESAIIGHTPSIKLTPIDEVVQEAERGAIRYALELFAFDLKYAAEQLGTTKGKLLKRIEALGMRVAK